jgi:hypothetical protein
VEQRGNWWSTGTPPWAPTCPSVLTEGKFWLPLFLSRLAEPGNASGMGRGTNVAGLPESKDQLIGTVLIFKSRKNRSINRRNRPKTVYAAVTRFGFQNQTRPVLSKTVKTKPVLSIFKSLPQRERREGITRDASRIFKQ